MVGKDATELISKVVKLEDRKKIMRALETTLEGKSPPPGTYTLLTKNGREIPVAFTASFVKDEEGKPTAFVVTYKDITELKRAEEERLKAAADKQRIEELEKFAKVAVGRELKMVELKQRIKELESKLKKITGNE